MSPQGTPNPPCHNVGKGLMTAHSLVINELVTLVVPLLVKDKQHAVRTAYSIVILKNALSTRRRLWGTSAFLI